MTKQAIVLISTFIFYSFIGLSQTNVFKVGNAESISPESEGVFYSLPQTVVRVDVNVNKIQKVKGPYAEFAEQMLGLSNVTRINSMEYELSDVKLSTISEPDPNELYFIKIPEKQKDREPIMLFLSGEGILTGAQIADLTENVTIKNAKKLNDKGAEIPEMAIPGTVERMDTVIKRISLDTTIIEQKFFKKTTSAKSNEQKAREAADFILKLDENMFNLITGYQEVNYDKGTMEFMYNRMKSMKSDYLELFKGLTQITQETVTFYFIPGNENLSTSLCRFSISKGIMPANSSTGDLVLIKANPVNSASIKSGTDKIASFNRNKHGIYYRIPSRADVAVQIGGLKLIESRFVINQLGVVTFLPAGNLKNIQLHNNTGALKSVVIE